MSNNGIEVVRVNEINTAQASGVPSFLRSLKRKNTKRYVFGKIFFRYFFLLAFAFVSGFLFCEAASKKMLGSEVFFSNIASHFNDVFKECGSLKSYSAVIISASLSELRYLILFFTSGFTYFCKIADSALLLIKGFTFGFSLKYLIKVINTAAELLKQPRIAVIIFTVSELAILFSFLFLSVKTLLFAYEFRMLRGKKRMMIRSPAIYQYIFTYLTFFGLMIIYNTATCIVTFLLFK